MIDKRLTFPAFDAQGNQLLELFEPGGGQLVKTASVITPEVEEFISTLKPQQGMSYLLMTGLGAGEFWSSNINGDWFPWEALSHEPEGWNPAWNLEQRRQAAWEHCAKGGHGYTTFYGAHPFAHHVNYDFFVKKNKNPIPRVLGEVVFVALNPQMRRVEIVAGINHENASKYGGSDFLSRIEHGEYPDVSMGCKVPFDICSICGNIARTRLEYCVHAKTMMNQILPDGRKVYVINTRPRFFDISLVLLGADRTGKVMGKVASVQSFWPGFGPGRLSADEALRGNDHYIFREVEGMEKAAARLPIRRIVTAAGALLGEGIKEEKQAAERGEPTKMGQLSRLYKITGAMQKSSSLRKRAVIDKPTPDSPEIRANQAAMIGRLNAAEPDIPRDTLNALGASQESGLATPSMMGIVLKPHEFQRMSLMRHGMGHVADALEQRNRVFRPVEESSPVNLHPAGFSSILRDLLMPMMAQRSAMGPMLGRRVKRIMITIVQPDEGPCPMEDDLLDKISADYNGYRAALVKMARAWPTMLENDQVLNEAVWGDDLIDLYHEGGTEKVASFFSPEQVAYLLGAYGWRPAGGADAASKRVVA